MDVNDLFTQALGMVNPWQVVKLTFDAEAKRLDIRVDFAPGSTFPCPVCAAPCKVHDASPQTWRHLNFFEHLTSMLDSAGFSSSAAVANPPLTTRRREA